MGQIEDYDLFVRIVETGSISRAADSLLIAKSAVSRRLALLEERFGAKLIERRPGHWSVTAKGEELFARVKPLVGEVAELEADFTTNESAPAGPLRISAPYHYGMAMLIDPLLDFQEQNPSIELTLNFEDRLVDIENENYDFAIRISGQKLENEFAHKIGESQHKLYASADYLAGIDALNTPRDLASCQILSYGAEQRANWRFCCPDGKLLQMNLKPHMRSNSAILLLAAVKRGLGIARLPEFICHESIRLGALQPVLENFSMPRIAIYLMRDPKKRPNKRMRVFQEFVQSTVAQTTEPHAD